MAVENNKIEDALINVNEREEPLQQERPFKDLEVQVSDIVQRLEAGIASKDAHNSNREPRQISKNFLEPDKAVMDEILETLEEIIAKTDPDREADDPALSPLNDVVRSVVLTHSVIAYLGHLDSSHLSRINSYIHSETTRWITQLFRFFEYGSYYHYDHLDGLVKITRMMLHYKYPRYLEDGGLALTEKLPSIYSSVASPLGIVQHLCRQLGLPLACIRPVPVDAASNQSMDFAALQSLIREDLERGSRVPLLVLAEAGATTFGHSDPLAALGDLCRTYDVWLHVRGHTLASLALPGQIAPTEQPRLADSVTLTLDKWLGVQGLPDVTVYRRPKTPEVNENSGTSVMCRESNLGVVAGLAGKCGAHLLPSLPLWVLFRLCGRSEMVNRIGESFERCRRLHDALNQRNIKILSKKPGGENGLQSIEYVSSRPYNATLLSEWMVPCVVFQYQPDDGAVPPDYCHRLNTWLGQIIHRELPHLNIQRCETESDGVVLRFCPLEATSHAAIDDFEKLMTSLASCLEQQLDILQATVALRETFAKLVDANPVLTRVNIPAWAGVGGVRYVPEVWSSLMPTAADLDQLTSRLVEKLRATDQAFSTGRADDGLLCVRFGMVTAETDIEELLNLVISAGREVEEQCKLFDTMTEIIKKGIEEAQADLERENAERLWAEGILKRVPVVGRLAGWWWNDPPPPVRGRTLQLNTGTVHTTEPIYKLHKQIAGQSVVNVEPAEVSEATPTTDDQITY